MKIVPDMLSVLSTAASEDVAPLLGGVDLALEGDPKLIRRWFWCKADSYCGLPLWVGRVYSIWRLCSVGALPASGAIKYYAGLVFPLCHHSPVRFPPLARRWMVVRGSPDVLSKVAPSALKGRSLFFGEPWSAPLLPPLVPSLLA